MACRKRVTGSIRSLLNARDLQLECARVLHESLLVPVLMYGSEALICREDRSRIGAVQMDNLRGLLGMRGKDKVPNARIRQIDEGVLGWLGHMERMENGGIAKRLYVGEYASGR